MSEEIAQQWLELARQRKQLPLVLRRVLGELPQVALRAVPDLSLEVLARLTHTALLAQGAEHWTGTLAGRRVQRYALRGRGSHAPVLFLHGLNASAGSMAPLLPAVLPLTRRAELFDLPAHGRSPVPDAPMTAREHGEVAIAATRELASSCGAPVLLVGNSLGGALAFHVAAEAPDAVAGVFALNPAGCDAASAAIAALPAAFEDALAGASRMAELLFHRAPWVYWLVARDLARGWSSATVQRILDEARAGQASNGGALDQGALEKIRARVHVLWGAEDRMLPAACIEELRTRMPHAQVEVLPGCGHIPQLEQPAYARRRLREFMLALQE